MAKILTWNPDGLPDDSRGVLDRMLGRVLPSPGIAAHAPDAEARHRIDFAFLQECPERVDGDWWGTAKEHNESVNHRWATDSRQQFARKACGTGGTLGSSAGARGGGERNYAAGTRADGVIVSGFDPAVYCSAQDTPMALKCAVLGWILEDVNRTIDALPPEAPRAQVASARARSRRATEDPYSKRIDQGTKIGLKSSVQNRANCFTGRRPMRVQITVGARTVTVYNWHAPHGEGGDRGWASRQLGIPVSGDDSSGSIALQSNIGAKRLICGAGPALPHNTIFLGDFNVSRRIITSLYPNDTVYSVEHSAAGTSDHWTHAIISHNLISAKNRGWQRTRAEMSANIGNDHDPLIFEVT